MVPTFLGVTLIAFLITRIVPGGPLEMAIREMRMGRMASEGGATGASAMTGDIPKDVLDEMKKALELDKPPLEAYLRWLRRVVVLDFGDSRVHSQTVWQVIRDRMPISIAFGLTGFVLAYLICIPLGILKAIRHGGTFDFFSSLIVFIGYSIPGWALGALLLLFFASGRFWDIFPLGGISASSYEQLPALAQYLQPREGLVDDWGDFDWEKLSPLAKLIDLCWHGALPILAYMAGQFATLTVLMKNSILESLSADYVRTAYAKGLSPARVLGWHVLRNSLIPLATGLGHAISLIMAGSYLIEVVFNIDGIGYLGYIALLQKNYPLVMGILAINTVLMLLGNLLSDLIYAAVDPRIRFE